MFIVKGKLLRKYWYHCCCYINVRISLIQR